MSLRGMRMVVTLLEEAVGAAVTTLSLREVVGVEMIPPAGAVVVRGSLEMVVPRVAMAGDECLLARLEEFF